jgi:hypothetical protein
MWPDLFGWHCAEEWRCFETLAKLWISIIRLNEIILFPLHIYLANFLSAYVYFLLYTKSYLFINVLITVHAVRHTAFGITADKETGKTYVTLVACR